VTPPKPIATQVCTASRTSGGDRATPSPPAQTTSLFLTAPPCQVGYVLPVVPLPDLASWRRCFALLFDNARRLRQRATIEGGDGYQASPPFEAMFFTPYRRPPLCGRTFPFWLRHLSFPPSFLIGAFYIDCAGFFLRAASLADVPTIGKAPSRQRSGRPKTSPFGCGSGSLAS